jgi:eukaryotic-like serine/threonine-protein kinase
MQKPWLGHWDVVKSLGEGGQGTTSVVHSKLDGSKAVLKILKKQNDRDRRRRMHREAEALRTLSHPAIPKLRDSNTGEFEGTTPLFMVIEYIEGPTLEEQVKRDRYSIDSTVALCIPLVDIVAYCHECSFGHRDIKPDNIVLRNGRLDDPVLIDFGLSFNSEIVPTIETGIEQQIGNRFLALPELTTPGSEKRDRRADLASCCGIFYFALSGLQPMTLRDEEHRPPHERRDFARLLDPLPARTRTLVNAMLGRGFMYAKDQRYQNAAELKSDLESILSSSSYPNEFAHVHAAIERAKLKGQDAAMSRRSREEALADVLSTFIGRIQADVKEQVELREASGLPISAVTVEPESWLGIAARVFANKKTNIFHYHCKTPGILGFDVYFQLQSDLYETEGSLRVRIFTDAPGQAVREAYFLLEKSGRWIKIGSSPLDVDASYLVEVTLALIDDEHLWAGPE